MRVTGPLWSIRASGWFGKITYAHRGFVVCPYPLAIRAAPYPYHKVIHDWGAHYHPYGWTYERRRTWHGLVNVAKRSPVPVITRTVAQQAQRMKFKYGMDAWKSMDKGVQDYYNKLTYPTKATGRCRFLHYYLTGKPV